MAGETPTTVTLVGAGTIGISFAALYLQQAPHINVIICDTRPYLEIYVRSVLPTLLEVEESHIDDLLSSGRLTLEPDLKAAVANADIVQEQGPEDPSFKQNLWRLAEVNASSSCLFWSSTSGIPATVQSQDMTSKTRVLVVHPYNPPHVMPLIEIVPSPSTCPSVVSRTVEFWKTLGRSPVVLKKEITGFVANRLAFALLREAIHIVNEGVVDVAELDQVVEASMGPRWAKAGPFKSYAAGGGERGFEGFMEKIGKTIQSCWDDIGTVNLGENWEREVYRQTKAAYGVHED